MQKLAESSGIKIPPCLDYRDVHGLQGCFHCFNTGKFGRKSQNNPLNLSHCEEVKEIKSVLKQVNLVYQAEEINESAKTNIV